MTFQGIPAVIDGEEVQLQPLVPLMPMYEEGLPCVPMVVKMTPYPLASCGVPGKPWIGWSFTSDLSDDALEDWIRGCKDRLLEPYSRQTIATLEQLLFELEATWRQRRQERAEKAQKLKAYSQDKWQDYDLLGAITAVCGTGIKKGNQWWFHCALPGHPNGDRHASLEVDPERKLWNCHSRHGGGGVMRWRKMVE